MYLILLGTHLNASAYLQRIWLPNFKINYLYYIEYIIFIINDSIPIIYIFVSLSIRMKKLDYFKDGK